MRARHRLVDDDDARRALAIARVEQAALLQRNAERLEIAAADGAVAGHRVLRRPRRRPSLDVEVDRRAAAAHRQQRRDRRARARRAAPRRARCRRSTTRCAARRSRTSSPRAARRRRARAPRRSPATTCCSRAKLRISSAAPIVSTTVTAISTITSAARARRCHGAAAHARAPGLVQRLAHVHARRLQRRHQPEDDAGDERQPEREERRRAQSTATVSARGSVGPTSDSRTGTEKAARTRPGGAAGDRDQHALGEQVADRRAQRLAPSGDADGDDRGAGSVRARAAGRRR